MLETRSHIDSEVKPRPQKFNRLYLVALVTLVVLVVLAFRYRRELYVYVMIELKGATLAPRSVAHVLDVQEELIAEELANTDSEASEIDALRRYLTNHHSWVRVYALVYIDEDHSRLGPQLTPELVTILEQEQGAASLLARDILLKTPKFTAPQTQRLLTLASSGDPGFRKVNALLLMRRHPASFDQRQLFDAGLSQAVASDVVVREAALRLLQSLDVPLEKHNALGFINSDYKEPQIAGLEYLVESDPESAVHHASLLLKRGHPDTKQLAKRILRERDQTSEF